MGYNFTVVFPSILKTAEPVFVKVLCLNLRLRLRERKKKRFEMAW